MSDKLPPPVGPRFKTCGVCGGPAMESPMYQYIFVHVGCPNGYSTHPDMPPFQGEFVYLTDTRIL